MFRRSAISIFLPLCVALFAAGCSNELKVSEVEPASGTYGGQEEVVIHGNGFQPGRGGVSVRFGRREATNVVVESTSAIKVTTPAGDKSTSVDVSVVFDDGKAFVLKSGFQYIDTTQQRQTMDKAFNAMGGKK
ncbi:MAG: IPT/TIG domain-containing protein [Polyangia bacterium]